MITPPFGVNLFAACTVATFAHRIVGHLLPFVGVILVCLLVITYVPIAIVGTARPGLRKVGLQSRPSGECPTFDGRAAPPKAQAATERQAKD